jgi:exopolysaccharide production protein ExoY
MLNAHPANKAADRLSDSDSDRPFPRSLAQVKPFEVSRTATSPASVLEPWQDDFELPTKSAGYRIGKRIFDLILAVAIAPIVGLLIGAIAVAVAISTGGPIFFRQRRIGQYGREFLIWKFRTMHRDAEHSFEQHLLRDASARHEWNTKRKLRNDPRTTRLGHLLRVTSLDELPQLLNILLGDMSFVGPRPIVRAEAAKYGDSFSYYLAAVPGMTGLWQVSGRGSVGYKTRVALDTLYVSTWSLSGDLSILLKTPRAVFRREGAY